MAGSRKLQPSTLARRAKQEAAKAKTAGGLAAAVGVELYGTSKMVDRRLAERSLHQFVKQAWHVVEPSVPYSDNWHIKALCDHLEAVADGRIEQLLANVPPGTMKPISEEEYVVEQRRGRIKLKDVAVGDYVLTHRGRFRRVTAVHAQEELDIVEIKTAKGRVVRAALDHPFLTTRGWVAAGLLTDKDVLGAVRTVDDYGGQTVTPEEARLLGYLIGDGCCIYQTAEITNADPAVLEDIEYCAKTIGFKTRRKIKKNNIAINIVLLPVVPGGGIKWHESTRGPHPVWSWLKKHCIKGKSSCTKTVPPAILAGNANVIGNFIGAYWSCDGCVAKRVDKGTPRLIAESVSKGLFIDLQHLLLKLGMSSGIRTKVMKLKSKRQGGNLYTCYSLTVDAYDGHKFPANAPTHHSDKQAAASKISAVKFDTLLAEDGVESVLAVGKANCRCLTVDEDSSFTVGDLAVHNSLLTCVFFPAWVWTNRPEKRFMFSSYAEALSLRDSRKCRDVVQSEWYAANWPLKMVLNTDGKYQNDKGGWRMVGSVGGKGIGEHPDFNVADDIHNVKKAESDQERQNVVDWIDGTFCTRGVSRGVRRIVIMQRLHVQDASGHLLAKGGWVHLCLPMRYESAAPVPQPDGTVKMVPRMVPTPIGWSDPRTEEGQLLWPALYTEVRVQSMETNLGLYHAAGQLQQRPAPRGGGKFKRVWFEILPAVPVLREIVRYWDKSGTKGGNGAKTAGVLMARYEDPHVTLAAMRNKYIILDVRTCREAAAEREALIKQCAELDRQRWGQVKTWVEQEPGSGGKESAESTVGNLVGFATYAERVTGSKEVRADPLSSQASVGKVKLLAADWNQQVLDELEHFPVGKLKDIVDASSGAFNKLATGSGAFGAGGDLSAPGAHNADGIDTDRVEYERIGDNFF